MVMRDHLEEGEVVDAGPRSLVRGPKLREDLLELVSLVLPREQRLTRQELGKNAADRPHVYLRRPQSRHITAGAVGVWGGGKLKGH